MYLLFVAALLALLFARMHGFGGWHGMSDGGGL
jgi:hypothetical protein